MKDKIEIESMVVWRGCVTISVLKMDFIMLTNY